MGENSLTVNGVVYIPIKIAPTEDNCSECGAKDICSVNAIPCSFFGGLLGTLVILKKAKID